VLGLPHVEGQQLRAQRDGRRDVVDRLDEDAGPFARVRRAARTSPERDATGRRTAAAALATTARAATPASSPQANGRPLNRRRAPAISTGFARCP